MKMPEEFIYIMKKTVALIAAVIVCASAISGCSKVSDDGPRIVFSEDESNSYYSGEDNSYETEDEEASEASAQAAANAEQKIDTAKEQAESSGIPAYSGSPYAEVNGNVPYFEDSEITTAEFEVYSSLDSLGRCGAAYANISTYTMPTEERGSIGSVKPTGWHTIKYDIVDGKYLYNRCHLIGYQLAGENANEKNLITGTRYMNVEGMLPFENMVADYVEETGNHVLYRVTPIFTGDNLLADGVLMEALSVEDDGDGIMFCVYCYNVQPGVTINYATGDSSLSSSSNTTTQTANTNTSSSGSSSNKTTQSTAKSTTAATQSATKATTAATQSTTATTQATTAATQAATSGSMVTHTYVLNTNTMKFHYESCYSVAKIKAENLGSFTGTRDELIAQGYSPCGNCNP